MVIDLDEHNVSPGHFMKIFEKTLQTREKSGIGTTGVLRMGQIICIASLKGGVGKTTTAVNLSTALAIAEKKSLLVDCDPQGHATSAMGINKAKLTATIYHVITGRALLETSIIKSDLESLNTLPARIELMRAEAELMKKPYKEKILHKLLCGLKETYDYIIIDSSPSLSLLTVNAISAADSLLIPLQCEFYALEGVKHLLKAVQILKKHYNPKVKISGLLLTMFDGGENICRIIGNEVRNHFKQMVFNTVIPRSVHLREAAVYGRPLLLKDISSAGAQSYLKLAKELIDKHSGQHLDDTAKLNTSGRVDPEKHVFSKGAV